jgi:hypothetical protein
MYDDAERRQRYHQRRRLTRSILIILVIGIGSAIGAFRLGSNLDTTCRTVSCGGSRVPSCSA